MRPTRWWAAAALALLLAFAVVLADAPARAAIGRVSARPPTPRSDVAGSLLPVGRLSGHSSPVTAVAFSPSGAVVAAASEDGSVRLWETATGREPRAIATGQGVAESLAFSPDGARLATGGRDGTLKLWRVATGLELRAFHHDEATALVALAFARDGATLVAGYADGTVSLWDASSGRERLHLVRDDVELPGQVALSPDGRLLASADDGAGLPAGMSGDWTRALVLWLIPRGG